MEVDYLIRKEGGLSTYGEDIEPFQADPKFRKLLIRFGNRIADADNYQDLTKIYEIKLLDPDTGLREVKLDRLRVLHILAMGPKLVLLGAFMKKTKKTPPQEIAKNNNRIKEYQEQKHEKPSDN